MSSPPHTTELLTDAELQYYQQWLDAAAPKQVAIWGDDATLALHPDELAKILNTIASLKAKVHRLRRVILEDDEVGYM